jgi:formate dehydrogenase subunit gamma
MLSHLDFPTDTAVAAAQAAQAAGEPLTGFFRTWVDQHRYIDDRLIPIAASAYNLSQAEVLGTVSFYHDFRRTPPGRHVVQLCGAEACQATGVRALAAHLAEQTGPTDPHGTSTDGRLTVETIYCLGLCANGPAALIDGQPYAALDTDKLDRLLAAIAP